MLVFSWNERDRKGVSFTGGARAGSHRDATTLGRPLLKSSPELQETAMQNWMSRSPPRAKFTANDWLIENSNNLKWIAIVFVGLLLAELITSR